MALRDSRCVGTLRGVVACAQMREAARGKVALCEAADEGLVAKPVLGEAGTAASSNAVVALSL
jgi:hypothetical protein